MKFGHKLVHDILPIQITKCTTCDHLGNSLMKTHNYGTRNKYLLNVPKAKTSMYLESIFCKGPLQFTQLPAEIKK